MVLIDKILLPTLIALLFGSVDKNDDGTLKPVNNEQNSGPWNYDNPNEQWGRVNSQCNGFSQSGIDINIANTTIIHSLPLRFFNYDMSLAMPVNITNDGITVNLNIDKTINGLKPSISGGLLSNKFEAVNIHFHWGSPTNKGSEHLINGHRYDIEMHIVHKNEIYPTIAEAIRYKNGLAVLGFFIDISASAPAISGLEKIFGGLNFIQKAGTSVTLDGSFSLSQLIGKVNTKTFFTYAGSLTTPPCSQAVTWHVFPDVLKITKTNAHKFYNLLTAEHKKLINNFRPQQERNNRFVFYVQS